MSTMDESSAEAISSKKPKNGPKSGLVGHHGPSEVNDLILHYLDSDDEFIREMAKKMELKFIKYCSFDSLNLILVVAMVLDPRYKLQYVEYWYSTYLKKTADLSDTERSEKVDAFDKKIKCMMADLYNHYKRENSSTFDAAENYNYQGDLANLDGMTLRRPKSKELFRSTLKRKEHIEASNDLDKYLDDDVFEADEHQFNILAWWQEKISVYRALAMMARDILAIPITSVALECAFSTVGRVLDPFRSSLTPTIVEYLICTQDWLKSPMPSITVEETLESLEEIEEVVMAEMRTLDLGSANK